GGSGGRVGDGDASCRIRRPHRCRAWLLPRRPDPVPPISAASSGRGQTFLPHPWVPPVRLPERACASCSGELFLVPGTAGPSRGAAAIHPVPPVLDLKSTRLNSS